MKLFKKIGNGKLGKKFHWILIFVRRTLVRSIKFVWLVKFNVNYGMFVFSLLVMRKRSLHYYFWLSGIGLSKVSPERYVYHKRVVAKSVCTPNSQCDFIVLISCVSFWLHFSHFPDHILTVSSWWQHSPTAGKRSHVLVFSDRPKDIMVNSKDILIKFVRRKPGS